MYFLHKWHAHVSFDQFLILSLRLLTEVPLFTVPGRSSNDFGVYVDMLVLPKKTAVSFAL